ncbi:rhodanese-related sulfurtransferase [uncultured Pelagimonas sp.]|uniref:oxygen-dependent tRNA uridine(34) hydroxylase TrhO n=1 Tax=uncultured Pelagimonas sp. TaxID=1618102 RepID=UPI00261FA0DA|nr:rhodanese-related sulfurtransferase [uncultured Pelagimonas sp.]
MFTVCALYHFTRFDNPDALREPLLDICRAQSITGTLLLAQEGINGTIAGPASGIEATLAHIRSLPGCDTLEWKLSSAQDRPFARMKVRLKREIVTMGQPNVDPTSDVGNYVDPADWNDLISSPDVAVIDTRNDYEVSIGTFDGAIDPKTATFRDFPEWWERNKDRFHNKRIAMFCTGGIRCEKSTNWLKQQGVEDVYHLKGGILKYLEDIPSEESTWNGECFVFDGRVSVGHGLQEGPHLLCHACRKPILPEDKNRPEYEHGVSCHLCVHDTSEDDKTRFRERQKQIALASARGERHLHADVTEEPESK